VERTNDRVLSALAGLQGNPDFAVIREWVIASRDADQKAMMFAKDEVAFRWLQGSVQTLNAIIELGDSAMGIQHRKRTQ
jgi:hypothetical protein